MEVERHHPRLTIVLMSLRVDAAADDDAMTTMTSGGGGSSGGGGGGSEANVGRAGDSPRPIN